jgi:NAD(P)-dependent dehydrogenase (short-subunit alcohol dehydrogenase family)
MQQLRGQHVVVTGATGGLGPSVVATLLACGATVTAVGRRRTALDALRAELAHNDRLHVAEGDPSDGPRVETLFDALERGTGPVTGVVHAVGGFEFAPLADTTDETVDALTVALWGTTVRVARAAVRRMVPRKSGRIVLVGGLASTKPTPGMAVYGALKAAIAHFTQSIAAEVRGAGVTVNAVLPGTMDTEANRAAMPGADRSRWVAPETVAKVVAVLLGDDGGGISGSLVAVPDAQ